jgi:hypothetical protein
LADMEGLSVAPVASTPAPAGRGKSTDGGREAAKRRDSLRKDRNLRSALG